MTTEHVRKSFALDFGPYRELAEKWFDEWLQAEKAEAWDEGQDSCSDSYPWEDNPYRTGEE